MRRRSLLAAIALVLVACSSGDDASPETTAVESALALSSPTVGGGELDLGTYAGRNLALWFWAPY